MARASYRPRLWNQGHRLLRRRWPQVNIRYSIHGASLDWTQLVCDLFGSGTASAGSTNAALSPTPVVLFLQPQLLASSSACSATPLLEPSRRQPLPLRPLLTSQLQPVFVLPGLWPNTPRPPPICPVLATALLIMAESDKYELLEKIGKPSPILHTRPAFALVPSCPVCNVFTAPMAPTAPTALTRGLPL